ncbi:unnamed protein product [Polarella glacialis]|uniref:Stress-response A/B barrel domain-containing protein n=1 Tax=Polarella glacialis TaxID=89957 RepID=A0A813ECB1_POLGL|nr:unnamed protein product [Polarella glacialis]CAE8654123.1 unnamed protein product [Polarella glacialis]
MLRQSIVSAWRAPIRTSAETLLNCQTNRLSVWPQNPVRRLASLRATYVARRMVCKVSSEDAVKELDVALKDAITRIWPKVPGVLAIERFVCTKDWDYTITIRFEHHDALNEFLESSVMKHELYPHLRQFSHLFVGGMKCVQWQNFAVERML